MTEKTSALRYDSGKLRLDLIPSEVVIELARVYTEGAKKYSDNNWKKGMDWSRCLASLKRHLIKWEMGNIHDSETGCHELAHVMWNVATLMYYQMYNLGTDNRDIRKMVDDAFNYVDPTPKVNELDRRAPKLPPSNTSLPGDPDFSNTNSTWKHPPKIDCAIGGSLSRSPTFGDVYKDTMHQPRNGQMLGLQERVSAYGEELDFLPTSAKISEE